jgi:putative membrane protein
MHDHPTASAGLLALAPAALALLLAVAYVAAAWRDRHRRAWPAHRTVLWILGLACAAAAVTGPLADAAHEDLVAHMAGHLLLGMLAPLLLVRAAPVTLALRSLDVVPARRLTALLRSRPVTFVAHPVPAAVLNVGGMWLVYGTPVLTRMHGDPLLTALVDVHVLAAGCLFTAAVVGVDPSPHRPSPLHRGLVLVAATAAHGILAKQLYAMPPAGVPRAEAELAAQVMYHGGDVVDVLLLVLLCAGWYRATRPRGTGVPGRGLTSTGRHDRLTGSAARP